MYANSYNDQAGLSNNPFLLEDPSTAHARFPDLTASSPQPAYPNYQQYNPQSHLQPYGFYQAQPQAISSQSQFTSTPYPHQYQGQVNPAVFQSTAGVPQQQQYPIPSSYPYSGTTYQSTNATPGYLAEFDPYAQHQPQRTASHISSTYVPPSSSGTGPPGISHPRDLIRTHKSGLEAWDTYAWKQLFSACDALKEAWSARKQQAQGIVRQYGGLSDPGLFGSGPDLALGYNGQVEGWKQVLKDASDNFDTVAASTFQLHEVFNSYRQSGDQASKRRVRESCNAAVNGLPDWPSN